MWLKLCSNIYYNYISRTIIDINSNQDDDFGFDDEEEPSLWHFPLKLHVTEEMFPKIRVLLYFITDTGEMVADTHEFKVEPCIGNDVSYYKENDDWQCSN